jgi:hypothetical protein
MLRRRAVQATVADTGSARRRASWWVWCMSVGVAAAAPAIATAAPDAVQVSHFELEALRQWPRLDIRPEERDLQAMLRAGRSYVFATARICIDRAGVPTTVELVERSGFGGYDGKLISAMRTWRYSPVMRDGEARAACAPVAFMFHPSLQLVPGTDSGKLAVFVGRELTSTDGSGVKAHYEGKSIDVRLATRDDAPPVDGTPVHVLLSNYASFELILWARPGDLASVLREPTLLAPTADEVRRQWPSDISGVRIKRGAPVRILGRKQSLAKIQLLGDDGVTGWIAADLLVKSYRRDVDSSLGSGRQVFLPGKTLLRDRPGGKSVIKLRAQSGLFEADELDRRDDQVQVVVDERHWWAVGWVDAEQLQRPVRRQRPASPDSGRPTIAVPQGALVFDKPRGAAIGRVNRETIVEALRVAADHTQIDIELDGLHVNAWVVTPSGPVQR